ncbi:MAG: hypothetical protein HYY56_07035 [Candidatus Omnitrophica bacterium]|nr:hypothetical protein [Candidatus Omnitrophota bacterium]MBI3009248.1 hypothetical protein [Candidatus Omnitrophota bacterium]
MISEVKKEISGLEITHKTLRNFGLLFCVIFGIWAGIMFLKAKPYCLWFAVVSIAFFLSGMLFPEVLRQFYRIWMSLAFVLGWFMTRVLLSIVFFVVVTPIRIILKALGKDLLDEGVQKESRTYWKKYETAQNKERYQKQF